MVTTTTAWLFLLLFIAGAAYFLPSLLAKGHKHESSIVILNLLLGWTFIGWAIALIWALSDEKD